MKVWGVSMRSEEENSNDLIQDVGTEFYFRKIKRIDVLEKKNEGHPLYIWVAK